MRGACRLLPAACCLLSPARCLLKLQLVSTLTDCSLGNMQFAKITTRVTSSDSLRSTHHHPTPPGCATKVHLQHALIFDMLRTVAANRHRNLHSKLPVNATSLVRTRRERGATADRKLCCAYHRQAAKVSAASAKLRYLCHQVSPRGQQQLRL